MSRALARNVIAVWVAGIVAVACNPPPQSPHTEVTSRRGPELQRSITDLFVISNVGASGEISNTDFELQLVLVGQECGLRVDVVYAPELRGGPTSAVQHMQASGSTNLLTIALDRGIKAGSVAEARYDAKLFDLPSRKLRWRANLRLVLGSSRDEAAAALVTGLSSQMTQDSIVPFCEGLARPVEPETPASR